MVWLCMSMTVRLARVSANSSQTNYMTSSYSALISPITRHCNVAASLSLGPIGSHISQSLLFNKIGTINYKKLFKSWMRQNIWKNNDDHAVLNLSPASGILLSANILSMPFLPKSLLWLLIFYDLIALNLKWELSFQSAVLYLHLES